VQNKCRPSAAGYPASRESLSSKGFRESPGSIDAGSIPAASTKNLAPSDCTVLLDAVFSKGFGPSDGVRDPDAQIC